LLGFGEPIAKKGSVLQILSVAIYNHYKRIYFESSKKGNAKQSNSSADAVFLIEEKYSSPNRSFSLSLSLSHDLYFSFLACLLAFFFFLLQKKFD
jgi:hypothetical protein